MPNLGGKRPSSTKKWPKSAKCGPARIGQCWSNVGRTSRLMGQLFDNSAATIRQLLGNLKRGRRWRRSPAASKSTQQGLHPFLWSGQASDAQNGHHPGLPTPRRSPDASVLGCVPPHPTRRRQPGFPTVLRVILPTHHPADAPKLVMTASLQRSSSQREQSVRQSYKILAKLGQL